MTNYDVRMFDNDERTIELTERFDVDKARQLLLSDLLDAKGKRILRNYLTKLSGNAMQVQYTNESLGRLEAKVLGLKKNETCSSQMNLWNVMKATGPFCTISSGGESVPSPPTSISLTWPNCSK